MPFNFFKFNLFKKELSIFYYVILNYLIFIILNMYFMVIFFLKEQIGARGSNKN